MDSETDGEPEPNLQLDDLQNIEKGEISDEDRLRWQKQELGAKRENLEFPGQDYRRGGNHQACDNPRI